MRSYSLLEKSMDIFSAGCVIAEILMDGNPLFDIEKLKKYGKGNYDPKPDLAKKIQDSKIVDIIMKMISIEPSKRPSIAVCIKMWNESTMPICFHKVLYQLTSSYVRP
jgi:phosphoinositide-3-kinase, regulatory subunit 4